MIFFDTTPLNVYGANGLFTALFTQKLGSEQNF